MGISIRIDQDSGVAIVACSGALRVEDAQAGAESLWSTPGWSGASAVWDFREARFDVSAADVRAIAKFILDRQREEPPKKMAFVTPRDADFGMARMFQVFREDAHTAFRVFRDYEEALSWAGR